MSFSTQCVTPEQEYQRQLVSRGISPADAQILGLELLNGAQTNQLLGFGNFPSIKLPYYGLDGFATDFTRVRLLYPNDRMKYSQPRKSGAHIYFTPSQPWADIATDINVPIIITEGEFKAWAIYKALISEGLQDMGVIGLAGVTSWGGKNNLPLHSDLMHIIWSRKKDFTMISRRVFIIFDYDGKEESGEPNLQVAVAEAKLGTTLRGMGADVHFCRVGCFGSGPGKKYAIDDHLTRGGTLEEVILKPKVVLSGIAGDSLDVRLCEFGTEYAMMEGGRVLNLETGGIVQYASARIDLSHRHIFIPAPTPTNPNKLRKAYLLDEFKEWSRKTWVKQIGMYPEYQGYRLTPDGNYNTFRPWKTECVEGSIIPHEAFCSYFFSEDPTFEKYWHDWIANILQFPWRRHLTAPQLLSPQQGVGKSYAAELVARLIGSSEMDGSGACVAGPGALFQSFNGILEGKVLVVVNEPSSDNDDHSAKLKDLITGDTLRINRKNKDDFQVTNYVNFIFTSNKNYVAKMTEDSRRDAVYRPTNLDAARSKKLIEELEEWIEKDQGLEKIMNWYMTRNIDDFDPRAPAAVSTSKKAAADLSKTDTRILAEELWSWTKREVGDWCFMTRQQREIIIQCLGWDDWRGSQQALNRELHEMCDLELGVSMNIGAKIVRGVILKATGWRGARPTGAEADQLISKAIERVLAAAGGKF